MPSVAITSNSAKDQFVHFNNSAAITVAPMVNVSGTSTTTNFNGFTNEGTGSVTIGVQAQTNVSNFQTYGTMTVNPAPLDQNFSFTTLVTNVGPSVLGFNAGSRTFIGTPQTAVFPQTWPNVAQRGLPTFVAGIDLKGKNLVVTGGLFVNNGYIEDSTNNFQGTATVVADYGAVVKGAGYFQNTVVTINGGKFQAGNSPGHVFQGSVIIGPGQLSNYNWQINDAGPSSTFPSAPGIAGPSPDTNNKVSGWSLVSAAKVRPTDSGNFTWNATNAAGSQFNMSLQTLLGPTTTVGNDVQGPMSDFDPNLTYLWKLFDWTGTYTGPTSDATLTASTLFDFTNFNNTGTVPANFTIHYGGASGTANEIDLAYKFGAVPEPGTLALGGLAATGLALRTWRRKGKKRPPEGSSDSCMKKNA